MNSVLDLPIKMNESEIVGQTGLTFGRIKQILKNSADIVAVSFEHLNLKICDF
jgi:hypothetical protein